jgi:uncharacterized membrane protein
MNSSAAPIARVRSIDALRGTVMVLMALDHVRDFFHRAAMSSSPEDLATTSPMLFFTRWVTHFCAPTFMFTAGLGGFLWWQRNHSKGELSTFLWTRGLWLVVLELTVIRLAFNFSFSLQYPVLLLVFWALGACMIVLAVLVQLPIRWLAVLSVALIVLHNCLDRINAAQFGSFASIWNLIHQPGAFPLAGLFVVVGYPLIPWVAVMAGGFCFGEVFRLEPAARQRILLRTGLALTCGFVVMRALNVYGDPQPWSTQHSPVFTLLSFLRCTKYPPSLEYLLLTLGPALLLLAFLDSRQLTGANPLVILGRVPLFYFVVHFFAIHTLAAVMAWFRYGSAAFAFMFTPMPSLGGAKQIFPADFGYSLPVVYVVWLAIVGLMYPLSRWFAQIKASRRAWWLSYL